MPLTESTQDGRLALLVEGGLTIFEASAYKPQLLSIIDQVDGDVDVDLSAVAEIDTAGLQLLLLMQREAASQDKQLRFIALGPAVQALVDMLHMHDRFPASSPHQQESA